jgi:hypothetical protein
MDADGSGDSNEVYLCSEIIVSSAQNLVGGSQKGKCGLK